MADHETTVTEVRGCRIALRRGGAGACMLYLHGAAGAGMWLPFMARLAESFDLVVPEHPGFGASETPPWLDNIHDVAYFYLDFLEALDLKHVHLVGSSLGGWIALEMAVRNSARLATLTLSAPAGLHLEGVPKGDMFLWSPEETIRQLILDPDLREMLLSRQPSDEEVDVELKNRETMARLAWSPRLYDPHLHKWLHRIEVPTHIIWGAGDRLLPPAYATRFHELIADSRVTLIPECGHLPHLEKCKAFCDAVTAFATGAAS